MSPTLTSGSSTVCWRAPITANAGRNTGSIWRGMPTPTALSSTRPGPTPGDTATGSSMRSNTDMPYDRFVSLQLAGDELEPADAQAFIATGFNRCYPDMVDLNDQALRRQIALNDITETTGLVFLGLTIGCARCHDHKFDPDPISDFYRLQAFFTPARFRDDYPIASAADREAYEKAARQFDDEITALERIVLAIETPVRSGLTPGLPAKISDETALAFGKPNTERTSVEVHLIDDAWAKDKRLPSETLRRALEPWLARVHRLAIGRLKTLRKQGPTPLPHARGLDETSPTAKPAHVLLRGDFASKGPEVEPGFPEVLCRPGNDDRPQAVALARSTGRRTALARLADAARPSTDGSRDRQPALATPLRPGPGRHAQRLRHDGRRAVPSRTARLAGGRTRRTGLEPQGDAPADGHECDLSAVVDR